MRKAVTSLPVADKTVYHEVVKKVHLALCWQELALGYAGCYAVLQIHACLTRSTVVTDSGDEKKVPFGC